LRARRGRFPKDVKRIACLSTTWRIRFWLIPVSETWYVMPMVNAM